jgi:hypothetical protein
MFTATQSDNFLFELSMVSADKQLELLCEMLTICFCLNPKTSLFLSFGIGINDDKYKQIIIYLKDNVDISEMTDWFNKHNFLWSITITGEQW